MLIQFRFKNFKSFRDETILDLSAMEMSEHSCHIINVCNEKLLPLAAIYGANASGKSNLIKAFEYMRNCIVHPLKSNNKLLFQPFRLDQQALEGESLFEAYYVDVSDETEMSYNYGFTLNKNGVQEEWLNVKGKDDKAYTAIFYRDGKRLELADSLRKDQESIKAIVQKETLVLSVATKLKIKVLYKAQRWFMGSTVINCGDGWEYCLQKNFLHNRKAQKSAAKYLACFDQSIVAVEIGESERSEEEQEQLKINFIHKMSDGRKIGIPWENEAGGIKKMYALYSAVHKSMLVGGVLFVDVLSDGLHPLLVRNILQWFINKENNPKSAQLVFTTNDTWQLANNLLRRDEIWFTEKDADGISRFYSLADFVSKDGDKGSMYENYGENYLLGKYGAIPRIKQLHKGG